MKPVPLLIAAAGLALLATACSGPPSPAGPGGPPGAAGSAVAYSRCVRSHGVLNFPDPASGGGIPKAVAQQLGVSQSRLQAAQDACRPLLPDATSSQQQAQQCMQAGVCPPALVQQMMTGDMKLARCMRSHGVPNFPDPTNGGSSGPVFNITQAGISDAASHTSQFETKLTECGRMAGANAPESFE
jgi:hypothetical protein